MHDISQKQMPTNLRTPCASCSVGSQSVALDLLSRVRFSLDNLRLLTSASLSLPWSINRAWEQPKYNSAGNGSASNCGIFLVKDSDKEEEKVLNLILKDRNAKNLPQWGCPAEPTQNLRGLDTPVKEWWFLKTTMDSKKQMVIFV